MCLVAAIQTSAHSMISALMEFVLVMKSRVLLRYVTKMEPAIHSPELVLMKFQEMESSVMMDFCALRMTLASQEFALEIQ